MIKATPFLMTHWPCLLMKKNKKKSHAYPNLSLGILLFFLKATSKFSMVEDRSDSGHGVCECMGVWLLRRGNHVAGK